MEGDFSRSSFTFAGDISIHSLRMEGDLTTAGVLTWQQKFQSTPSVWRETICGIALMMPINISIHSLRMEGD